MKWIQSKQYNVLELRFFIFKFQWPPGSRRPMENEKGFNATITPNTTAPSQVGRLCGKYEKCFMFLVIV